MASIIIQPGGRLMRGFVSSLQTGFRLWAVLVGCIAAGPGASPAGAVEDEDVVKSMTGTRLERIITSFSEVKNFKEVNNTTYSFEVDGHKLLLFNSGEALQAAVIFNGKKVPLSRLNGWNRDKKFTRAYLDRDGDPVLDHSLELTGGVTEKNVKEWLKTFVFLLREFKKKIIEDA
jgi:hypothetical protein